MKLIESQVSFQLINNYYKMNRKELLECLAKKDIEFYFEYSPDGESSLTCSNEYYKDFLFEEMFDYVMSSGNPVYGDFIVSRKNDDIIISSIGNLTVDWQFSDIEGFIMSEDDINKITAFFRNLVTNKDEDSWCYYLYVSKHGSSYEIEADLYDDSNLKKISNADFPGEIVAKIISAINGPNKDGSEEYGYRLLFTNSGESNEFLEYYSESFNI